MAESKRRARVLATCFLLRDIGDFPSVGLGCVASDAGPTGGSVRSWWEAGAEVFQEFCSECWPRALVRQHNEQRQHYYLAVTVNPWINIKRKL